MTNTEVVLALIRQAPGLTDTEIRERTGIWPHQQVNQICRRLERQGLVRREPGPRGTIVNWPAGGSPMPPAVSPASRARTPPPSPAAIQPAAWHGEQARAAPAAFAARAATPPERTLLVLACSGTKTTGGNQERGMGIADSLSPELSEQLIAARRRVARLARLNESRLLPAWRRYAGYFYGAAAGSIAEQLQSGTHVLILSGGYGVVAAREPIGTYEAVFNASWWPRGLIERCLAEYARRQGITTTVAFLSSSTQYAKVVHGTPWHYSGVERALLVSPIAGGIGGAQRLVPRAAGQAFAAFARGQLDATWASGDGLGVRITAL